MFVKVLSLLMTLSIHKGTAYQNLTDYKNLYNDLFNDYNPELVPFGNVSSLRWKPSDYNNITQITVSSGTVWSLQLVLLNNAQKLEPFGGTSLSKVKIYHYGYVEWSPADVINLKCAANMRKFPFDKQKCSFNFFVWEPSWNIYFKPSPLPYINTYETGSPVWIIQI